VKIIDRRLRKLESQFGFVDEKKRILLVVCNAGWGLALDQDRCIEVLGERGFLPTGPIGVVNLLDIPEGLNAEETERFLRENGAERFSFRTREDDQQISHLAVENTR
jgi:hypothetical protein